ncbi:Protein CBG26290 [Caenorhabditis briggsae]|uniref:Protein CBG26290 n=1 Tax=Caenorhabditis briggsae TaxID=6238 RepID=B6ILY8_CAEBR|nr:Protein CBG26290 [Caenorhabditis briggsae]CAS00918.1 Protein CBG26290 [Caenorhabditis briggsae]
MRKRRANDERESAQIERVGERNEWKKTVQSVESAGDEETQTG